MPAVIAIATAANPVAQPVAAPPAIPAHGPTLRRVAHAGPGSSGATPPPGKADDAAGELALIELDVARGLGRDHAAFGLRPAAALMLAHPALRRGFEAGRQAFAGRERMATPQARLWLDLRVQAWLDGQHVELATVTPRFIADMLGPECPVTRQALASGMDRATDAPRGMQAGAQATAAGRSEGAGGSRRGLARPMARGADAAGPTRITRLREDAAWAAGHLVALSRDAAAAAPGVAWADGLPAGQAAAMHGPGAVERQPAGMGGHGLPAAALIRLAVLKSFVTALPHGVAVRIPLRVLPPSRLRLLNPAQALQAVITLQLLRSGWSQRLGALEMLLPQGPARLRFKSVLMRLLSLALARGRPGHARAWRHALEDAWADGELQRLWADWALPLGASGCKDLAESIARRQLMPCAVLMHDEAGATEGWHLPVSDGHVLFPYTLPRHHPEPICRSEGPLDRPGTAGGGAVCSSQAQPALF